MRIGIVNDVKMAVEILSRVVRHNHEIAWTAFDGQEAIDKTAQDRPDLILMDLIMPGVNGVEATAQIMLNSPCPVLVVTATVEGNVSMVFDAMSAGALDAVNTPAIIDGELKGGQELLQKIDNIAKITKKTPAFSTVIMRNLPPVALIGASTGGPAVISEILSGLPANFPAAIIIAQHVDSGFVDDFAGWLGKHCAIPCSVCRSGTKISPGQVYIARSSEHLYLNELLVLDYTTHPKDYPHLPSINVLFESFARHWPKPGLAALLTGMGEDGASGLLKLKNAKWHTITQDQESSVVYGMPKAAVAINASMEEVTQHDLPGKIAGFFTKTAI